MKFHFVKQTDAMNCGISAIHMICDYYKCNVDRESLESLCSPTHTGISFAALKNAAEQIGFDSWCLRLPAKVLYRIKGPCILYWNQNHFVVLYKSNKKRKKFWIADPAKGKFQISEYDLEHHWCASCSKTDSCGIVMVLKPGTKLYDLKEQNKQTKKGGAKVLVKYLHGYKKYCFQILFALFLGCILQLIIPFLTQWIVDKGIRYKDISLIWLILIGEMFIVVGKTATDFIRRWLILHISLRINVSLVGDFIIKILRLPMSFFETKLLGDLLQRIEDHARVQSFLTNQLLAVIFSLMSVVVLGIILYIYNVFVFFVFISGSIVYGCWITIFLNKRKNIDYELFDLEALNQSITYQLLSSVQEVKLQNCERRRRWEWEDTQADLFYTQMKVQKLQQLQESGCIFINEIKNILITVFAATAVIQGSLTLGAMLAIQYVIGQLNSPVEQLLQFIYSMQDVKISLDRIREIHSLDNEDSEDCSLKQLGDNKTIEIKSLRFKYNKYSPNNVLEDISVTIPAGKVTAIVGASGSGKTTLLKLILGYYNPISGEIIISGHRVEEYNKRWWRGQCGVVMQNGVIFSESIARNIAVDDNDVDIRKMEMAAKIACIDKFIESLPMKYETKIGTNGTGLSQGQKQRILIARAVYKNPDYIFLDEATNALDANNEKAIVENLIDFYKGRTVIVVAHRLSTVKNADQIIVLDSGKVVEDGSHETLIKNKGYYYNLIKNQLELGA